MLTSLMYCLQGELTRMPCKWRNPMFGIPGNLVPIPESVMPPREVLTSHFPLLHAVDFGSQICSDTSKTWSHGVLPWLFSTQPAK
jgi:hypothetical protein